MTGHKKIYTIFGKYGPVPPFNSCQGKVNGVVVFLTELHKSSTCSGIGCDTGS